MQVYVETIKIMFWLLL